MLNQDFMVGNYSCVTHNGKIIPRVKTLILYTDTSNLYWFCDIVQFKEDGISVENYTYLIKSITINAMGGLQPEIFLADTELFPQCSKGLPEGL